MLKVFYVGGLGSSMGTLRAILSLSRLEELAASQAFTYAGRTFPRHAPGEPASTIVQVSDEEADRQHWQPGFYRAELGPQEFEERLKNLRAERAS